MQPMPAKTRTAMMAGAALLLLAVGIAGLWSARRENPADLTDQELAALEGPAEAGPAPGSESSPLETGVSPFTEAAVASNPNPGVALDPTTLGVESTADIPEFHVVALGDTLSEISRKYYNTHIYAGDIEVLNGLTENPNHLEVGQRLMLPRPEALGISQN